MYETNYILKDCLQNMYDSNLGLYQPKYRLDDSRELEVLETTSDERTLIQHDAQYFVFGCGTDIEGKLALQINVFLLTNMKKFFDTYNDGLGAGEAAIEGLKAFVKLGVIGAILAILKLILHLILTILKRLKFIITRQTLFPFSQTHKILDLTVDEIRSKYNIKPYNQN